MNPIKILVVDDEPDVQPLVLQMYRKQIKNGEFEFRFASNGFEAIQSFDSNEAIQLVVADINMPGMDGLTLLNHLKERNRIHKTIIATAYADMSNIRTAMNRGAHDFITKPIDFNDLETTIRNANTAVAALYEGLQAKENLAIALLEKEKAQQSEKFKQQFLAGMSHEIRTPLNAIIGLTNLLLKTDQTDIQQKYLSTIKHAGDHLLSIINDILDLAKIEAGKMELEQISFSLTDICNAVSQTLFFKAEEKNLAINVVYDHGIPDFVKGDPVRLSQILINLLGNAIKFTNQGKVQLDVKANPINNANYLLEFKITDTGIGIPSDKIDKLFNSFSQADTSTNRKFGGTGLGLSICKQLVLMHGGEINASSTPGIGSIFTVTLPYMTSEKPNYTLNPILSDLKLKDNVQLLLAEDNPFNQLVAVDTLKDLFGPVRVDLAQNGEEAVAKAVANQYDLILMDIQMPDMDGYEATKSILAANPKQKIMAMTANVTEAEIEQCRVVGMVDYITKPFSPDELKFKVLHHAQ